MSGKWVRCQVIKALAVPGIGAYSIGTVLDLTEAQASIFVARGRVKRLAPEPESRPGLPARQAAKLKKAAAEGKIAPVKPDDPAARTQMDLV